MKNKFRKRMVLTGVLILCAALILFYINKNEVQIAYIRFFKISAIVSQHDSKGKLYGDFYAFIKGQPFIKSHFKNGLRDGMCTWYDTITGRKNHEIFYKKGEADGIGNVYYKDGNLNYTVQWKNERYLNSQYHYSTNGKLANYNAFDQNFSKGNNAYFYVTYDKNGGYYQIMGNIFSSSIFSKCSNTNVFLKSDTAYSCIKDLYLNVATPPTLIPTLIIAVNDKDYYKIQPKNNLVIIPNVFIKSGVYEIKIWGKLTNIKGEIIKTDTFIISVTKN